MELKHTIILLKLWPQSNDLKNKFLSCEPNKNRSRAASYDPINLNRDLYLKYIMIVIF